MIPHLASGIWHLAFGRRAWLAALVALMPIPLQRLAAAERFPTENHYCVVSGPASPRVAYAARIEGSCLELVLDVASLTGDGRDTSVTIGLAPAAGRPGDARKFILGDQDATADRRNGVTSYFFRVRLADSSDEQTWSKLRLGIAVAWKGGPFGEDRQRERFLHVGSGAPHAGLSPLPSDWALIGLAEHRAVAADRAMRIGLDFDQPMDGKATLVLEDEQGRRVRNLFAGRPITKGRCRMVWDGLDEAGNVVRPGEYRWRAISHPGIRPDYLFSFCNDGNPPWRTGSGTDMWGPDHSCLLAAAAGRAWTFLGGPVAESGYAIVAVDEKGIKRMHYNPPQGTGLWAVALAVEGDFLYAAHDGLAWGVHVDRSRPDWKAETKLTITRFDIKTGRVVDFPNAIREERCAVASTLAIGPGSANPKWDGAALAGLAALGGRLYVSHRAANAILVLAADTAQKIGEIRLDSPGPLAAIRAIHEGGSGLLAVSKTAIVRVDPASGRVTPVIAEGVVSPSGLAVDADGNLYVADSQTHTVRVFSPDGKPLRELGRRGGPYAGRYQPERMVNPRGIALAASGWLWVTEDRWNPKRASAWDVRTGRLVLEKFGPTSYGASGAGFDAADPTRWIGQGALWSLDFERRSARCQAILAPRPGHLGGAYTGILNYTFLHQDGRTFLIGHGGATFLSELMPDGSLRDLAFVGSTHRFCFGCDWNPPATFVEAFNRAFPSRRGKHADKGPGVLWVDLNGDGICQPEEFDFSTDCENFAGAYWGHAFLDLTFRVPATVRGRRLLVALRPDGYHPGGAPRYPRLNAALAAAAPIDLGTNELETAVDRFGRVVANSDPEMKCFSPQGETLWAYPNRWSNVHGSHNAPLPEIGVMQGCLFFLGMAPFDDKADVFVLNGNHGRFFVLTSDGLYLDEMFRDVRMGASVDAYLIGGECFGGFFGRSEKDGTYYLQSGHTDYRIFRVHGLAEAKRSSGTVRVSPEQAIAAANALVRKEADAAARKETAIPFGARPPKLGGGEGDWPRGCEVRWDKSGKFPVTVRCAWDEKNLYLFYAVRDGSPWVNNGKDWTLLFKTGDSVDLQLGTDEKADPNRRQPVPGDLRLLIAPFEGKNVAVLYRHRVPGTKEPVVFTSPWRSEKVDSVALVKEAQIAVAREAEGYRVEAAIPLEALGLKAPAAKTLEIDFGVLYGDPAGTMTMLRSYWSNQATGLVNDVPGEIMLTPNLWGTARFEGAGRP